MIRVMHVVPNMDAGGLENYIMNLYRAMDREKIQFDFLVHYARPCFFDQEIERMGGKIYRMTVREDHNLIKYCRQLERFFRAHREYRIVHGHMSSLAALYLGYAKAHGVTARIIHSHNSDYSKNAKGRLKYLLSRAAKFGATDRFACSMEAGRYLFGRRPLEIVPNAVDSGRFRFDQAARKQTRERFGLSGAFVIGHVGRFNDQKNHAFLLEIFAEYARQDSKARLVLVGAGELEDQIHRRARELSIEEKILYTGVRRDTERLYQAFDVFVLPSRFEGLPVVGIEAQYAGLECLFSDVISREIRISRRVRFLPIGAGHLGAWVSALAQCAAEDASERTGVDWLTDRFEIRKAALDMAGRYESMWEYRP